MLGLSIVGGVDHASRVFGQGKPGVYISKVNKWLQDIFCTGIFFFMDMATLICVWGLSVMNALV
jgi:hypothetical protein